MTASFGAQSTAEDVLDGVDLSGKRILVTGASAGLGVETCRALATRGATLVGAVRDLKKGQGATEEVRAAARNGFSLVELNLASLTSVRACADALIAAGQTFDVVICNAGVMACPKSLTEDGFETQFGTNHLGHFVFVNRIQSLLKAGSRVVTLASRGHRRSDVDLEDPNFEHTPYTEFEAYGRSKTANILFAVGLDKRLQARDARATAVHPGVIQTELFRHMTADVRARMRQAAGGGAAMPVITFKTIPQGAATSVWSAIVASGEAVGGRYCEDCHVAEIDDSEGERPEGVRSYALDPAHAEDLWTKSEALVGEQFRWT